MPNEFPTAGKPTTSAGIFIGLARIVEQAGRQNQVALLVCHAARDAAGHIRYLQCVQGQSAGEGMVMPHMLAGAGMNALRKDA